jgi:hypothetical protein
LDENLDSFSSDIGINLLKRFSRVFLVIMFAPPASMFNHWKILSATGFHFEFCTSLLLNALVVEFVLFFE